MSTPTLVSDERITLADAGIETYLIYREGIDLPEFASFTALSSPTGRAALARYYQAIIDVAVRDQRTLLLDSATWRASADWGTAVGYSAAGLDEANAAAVAFISQMRSSAGAKADIVIGGCVGPRGDGYAASSGMSVTEATDYHAQQIASLARAGAQYIAGMTIGDANEAAGILEAARENALPAIVSFTIETDGTLASGERVATIIAETDRLTEGYAAYYLLNCAHPLHMERALASDSPEMWRVRGIRVNASMRSHAELDAATDLDDGDPEDLARRCADLAATYPSLSVLGGCCGTDARHISAMSTALGDR